MPAKISQEEREKQIKELCEGTIYSFIGWDGEYKNCYSKFICRCEEHGEWSTSIRNFTRGMRCRGCANDVRSSQRRKPRAQCEIEIKELCEGTIYSFVGWDGEYKNTKTKFKYQCAHHGIVRTSFREFIKGHRCRKCYFSTPQKHLISFHTKTKEQREKEIEILCNDKDIVFLGWHENFKDSRSLIRLKCKSHGEWIVKMRDFKRSRSSCPRCAVTGYQPIKKGILYCLRSDDGIFVKIGITNNLKNRMIRLKCETPFDFHVIELFTHEDGSKAREWEKLFHQSFESANLTGFDGCTEWLKWDPKIPEWFRFIN